MHSRKYFRFAILLAILALSSVSVVAADGSVSNANTVSSNLTLSATAETAITLTISTNDGASVTDGGSGAFGVSFGNVNGLGVGTPTSGVTVNVQENGALYTTPITVTPTFSGFVSTVATVKVYQDAGTSSDSQNAAREGSAAGSVSSVPSSSGTASVITSSAANATGLTRYVGIFVSNANGGSRVIGALAPKFIYLVEIDNE